MRLLIALTCLVSLFRASPPASADPSTVGERAEARADLYGDPLPFGAISRLGSVKLRHPQRTFCVAFSPDSRVLASGCEDRIRFWDVSTGRMLREFAMGTNVMAFSPDGGKLATGDGHGRPQSLGTVRLWDVSTGRQIFANHNAHVTERSAEEVLGIAWSPDGRWFASISGGNEIHLWDADDGSRIRSLTISDKRRRAYGFALSGDGRIIAASRDGEIQLWDLKADQKPRIIEQAHPSTVAALAFTPDGRHLVSAGHRFESEHIFGQPYTSQIRVWNPMTGKMTAELWNAERDSHTDASEPIKNLVVSSDGKLLVSAHQHELRLWDLRGEKLIDVIGSPRVAGRMGPHSLVVSPDRRCIATANGTHVIRLWETTTGRERFAPPGAHQDTIRTLAWSADGAAIATASFEGTVCLWDPPTGSLRHQFVFSRDVSNLVALAFSADGQIVAATGDYRVVGHSGRPGAVKLWDVRSGEPVREIRLSGPGKALAFSPDGRRLAACYVAQGPVGTGGPVGGKKPTPPSVSVFDLETGNTLFSVAGGGDLHHLAFTSDGKSLLFAPQVRRWDFALGKPPQAIAPADYPWGTAVAISADGRWLGLGHPEPERLELLDLTTGTAVWERSGNANFTGQGRIFGYNALEFSPDGRLLAARGPGEAGEDVVLEVRTGHVVRRLPSTTSRMSAVAFSPDGTKLVSGAGDGTALVWDLTEASGRITRNPPTEREWDDLWDALADPEAGRGYDAVWTLSALETEGVAFLEQRLKPAAQPDQEHIRKLIARLDDDEYEARRDASRELRTVARMIQKQLREASDRAPSAELQKRFEALLTAARSPLVSLPEEMRSLRAIEVLERIGGPEARHLLQSLSRGAPGAIETEESKSALARWDQP